MWICYIITVIKNTSLKKATKGDRNMCVCGGGEVTAIIVRDHELLKIACLISRQTGKCLCTITTLNFMKKQTCVIYSQFIPQCLSG